MLDKDIIYSVEANFRGGVYVYHPSKEKNQVLNYYNEIKQDKDLIRLELYKGVYNKDLDKIEKKLIDKYI